MEIARSDEHLENAALPIFERVEAIWNVTEERDWHR
jgi:hypothetical protein